MRKDRNVPAGSLHRLTINSKALQSNMLGDPADRETVVYVPAGHDGSGLPLLVDIVGFTASGLSHVNWKNFGENVPERADRLIAAGEMAPAVIAFPDCFTRLGGNQYINSIVMGQWETFLIDEMLPEIEQRFGCGGQGRRGIFGKSSGGFGAMAHALLHADIWAAAACHSGDMGFEWCYLPDVPQVLRAIAKAGSIESFITAFEAGPKFPDSAISVLNICAMAASYDPDPEAFLGIRLPVDQHTGELIEERWANWMRWDPLSLARQNIDALKNLKGLWIDCGNVDQFNMVYGARRLHKLLQDTGIAHVYEEFDDDHTAVDYRMDGSLPFLARALSA